jgi:hypothetical protein
MAENKKKKTGEKLIGKKLARAGIPAKTGVKAGDGIGTGTNGAGAGKVKFNSFL